VTPPAAAPAPKTRAAARGAAARRAAAPAIITLLALLLPSLPARAEAPRFTAEVDRNQVAVGETFLYQLTLSVGSEEASSFRPPDFKGMQVVAAPSGPNRSTQMEFGGSGMFVQTSFVWRYQLAASNKGQVTIGPARIKVAGQEIRSNSVTIAVGVAAAPPTAGAGPPGAAPEPGPDAVPPPAESNESVFLRAVVDKQRAYVGEAVAATWYLYALQPPDRYDAPAPPRTEGFWTEDVQLQASRRGGLTFAPQAVGGRTYQVAALMKKALFPLEPGKQTIGALEMDVARVLDFFGTSMRRQHLRADQVTIDVLPLPAAGQPKGFAAANVGTFTLAVRVDRAQVQVGEPVTVTVSLAGRGNLRKIAVPFPGKLDGWKSYEPRENVTVDPADGVGGTKTIEVLLLPERTGTVTIPALVFDYFDPEAKRYARASSEPITLVVFAPGGSADGGGAAAAPPGGGAVATAGGEPPAAGVENVIATEIRPIHARAALRSQLGVTLYRGRAFFWLVAAPPLGYVLAVAGLALRDRRARDSDAQRRRRTRRIARVRLAAAERHLERGEAAPFFIEIDRVLRETLAARLGSATRGMSLDELRAATTARGLPAGDADRLIAQLEECDRARFAPGGDGGAGAGGGLAGALGRASELIELVEKARLGEDGA
jgi:hypothetical protein